MRYPKGHDFEYRKLLPSQIKYDPLYQRQLKVNRVDAIVREFNGDLFNEPKVSWRDGCYWCFNGQHSVAAWRKLHNGEDKAVNCKVFTGMTWLDECEAFMEQNGISKDPTTNEKLRAAFNSKDPDVVTMVNLATMCGYTVDFSTNKTPTRIVATSALHRAFKLLGPEECRKMLTTIKTAWWGDMDAVSAQIISSMSKMFHVYRGGFDPDSLANSLKKITPAQIIRNGRQYTNRKNTYLFEIVKQYNKGRSKYRLDIGKLE